MCSGAESYKNKKVAFTPESCYKMVKEKKENLIEKVKEAVEDIKEKVQDAFEKDDESKTKKKKEESKMVEDGGDIDLKENTI